MDPLFMQIGLGVLFLVSLIFAYLGSKTWLVRHVVLVWFVFLTTVAFFYLSAKTLNVHAKWQEEAAKLDKNLARVLAQNKALEFGAEGQALLPGPETDLSKTGLRHLRHELHRLTVDRGPVWFDCQPAEIAPDGSAGVVIEQPVPHGIATGVRLFVFEQDQGGQYLGEFEVTESAEGTETARGTVAIRPTMDLADWQLDRIAQSQALWTLYRSMPTDRHDLFSRMTEEELEATIPTASREEYLKDGHPAAQDDPPERVVGYKADGTRAADNEQDQIVERHYVRQLRDYNWLLREFAQKRTLMEVKLAALDFDAVRLNDALAKGRQNVAYRQTELANLGEDLQKFQIELAVITEHLTRLEQQYAHLQARLAKVLAQNVQLAAEFTALEQEATRRIDSVTSKGP